jgi:hypothetical protein
MTTNKNSLGTTNPKKNTNNPHFEKWYSEHGLRYYSADHGSADGHKDYMRVAFINGWLYCSFFSNDLPEIDY